MLSIRLPYSISSPGCKTCFFVLKDLKVKLSSPIICLKSLCSSLAITYLNVMSMYIRLMIFFITFLPRMADNLLYSLYMKSSLYRPNDANIDIEIGDEKIRNQHLYEPNNRHSMYVDMNVSSCCVVVTTRLC